MPLLQPPTRPAAALDLFGGGGPRVELLSKADVCQGRCRDQDFVVVRYIGLRNDGTPFDNRYSSKPLTYELGSFYLPGVDDNLKGACVGSRYKFTWPRGVDLGPSFSNLLPADQPISLELELVSIRYSLFGEKMRNSSNTYWFAEEPLSLRSSPDYERGFASRRDPIVTKDNPFSVAPGEKSLISNPASATDGLVPLLDGILTNPLDGFGKLLRGPER